MTSIISEPYLINIVYEILSNSLEKIDVSIPLGLNNVVVEGAI